VTSPVLQALLWEQVSVYDQIVIKTWKGEEMGINTFLHKFPSKRWFTNGIHSLIKTKWCERERLHHMHYMTYIAKTRLTNN